MHKNIILCIFIILIIVLIVGLLIYKNKSSSTTTSSSTTQKVSSELFSESEKPLELQVAASTSSKKPCLENKTTVYAGCTNFVYGNKDQALKQCKKNLTEYTLITKGIENEDPCLLKRSSPIILTTCRDKDTKKNKAYFTNNAMIEDKCTERVKQWIGDGLEYNFDYKKFDNFSQIVLYGNNDDKMRALRNLIFNLPYNFYSEDEISNLFYIICLAGLGFIKGNMNNDSFYMNLDNSTNDLLYAISLLGPTNIGNPIVSSDINTHYTIADLFYKVFFGGQEGIDLWKKIINFNYNTDWNGISSLLDQDKNEINTRIELFVDSYIKPIRSNRINTNTNLYYFTVVYDTPIDLKTTILYQDDLNYIKNKNNLTYVFGAFNTSIENNQQELERYDQLIKSTNPTVYKIRKINEVRDVTALSFSPINTNDKYEDKSNNNIEILNFSQDIGRHVLPYIARSISLYK